jgi:hypothetical protein
MCVCVLYIHVFLSFWYLLILAQNLTAWLQTAQKLTHRGTFEQSLSLNELFGALICCSRGTVASKAQILVISGDVFWCLEYLGIWSWFLPLSDMLLGPFCVAKTKYSREILGQICTLIAHRILAVFAVVCYLNCYWSTVQCIGSSLVMWTRRQPSLISTHTGIPEDCKAEEKQFFLSDLTCFNIV